MKALALLAIADFVVLLDATIVNVAWPSTGRSLPASTSELRVPALRCWLRRRAPSV
jgi:hypothetical protein